MTKPDHAVEGSTNADEAPLVQLAVRPAAYLIKVGDRFVNVLALASPESPNVDSGDLPVGGEGDYALMDEHGAEGAEP